MQTITPSRWKGSAASRRRLTRIESSRKSHQDRINKLRRKLRSARIPELAAQYSLWLELRDHPDNHQTTGVVSPEEHRRMIDFLFEDEFFRRGITQSKKEVQ